MGSKAIIKINDRFCKQDELNRIAIVAPMAKVNIIENFRVTEKRNVTIPETVRGFVRCVNPKCITNNEPGRDLVHRDPGRRADRPSLQILRKDHAPAADRDSEISRPAVSPENTAAGNSELTFLYRFSVIRSGDTSRSDALPPACRQCNIGRNGRNKKEAALKKPHFHGSERTFSDRKFRAPAPEAIPEKAVPHINVRDGYCVADRNSGQTIIISF